MADGRHVHEAGTAGTIAASRAAHEAAAEQLTATALINRSQVCYLNSFLLSLSWVSLHAGGPASLASLAFLPAFLKGGVRELLPHMRLRPFLNGWQRVHAQHDVAEFATHLVSSANLPLAEGDWQTRHLIQGRIEVRDVGSTFVPLGLRLPPLGTACVLQDMVDKWASKGSAPISAPDLLMLQIGRFTMRAGHYSKVRDPMLFSWEVSIPIFVRGLQVTQTKYEVIALLFHLGDSPYSGHYRAMLRRDARVQSNALLTPEQLSMQALVTDDGKPAVRPSLSVIHHVRCNSYLILCLRADD